MISGSRCAGCGVRLDIYDPVGEIAAVDGEFCVACFLARMMKPL